jgi:hypothetical protein
MDADQTGSGDRPNLGPDEPGEKTGLRRDRIDFGRWIVAGWDLIKDDLLGYLVATFILLVVGVGSLRIWIPLGILILGPLLAGFFLMAANHIRTGRPIIGDLFAVFTSPRIFWQVLLAALFLGVLVFVGLVLLVIPGIIGLGIWMFTFLFITDRGLDFWDAMEASRAVARKDYLEFALFALVLFVLNMCGVLAFVVGVLFTLPISFAAITCAYRELIGLSSRPAIRTGEGPKAPPPDPYGGMVR